jgi:hypothetical protein
MPAVGLGNPLATMSGASDSLGLSAAAKDQAQAIADEAKKKKLQDQLAIKAGTPSATPSAFQALTGFGSV